MPEGPEVKIASDYFNKFFSTSKQIKFEIISEHYHDKYQDPNLLEKDFLGDVTNLMN